MDIKTHAKFNFNRLMLTLSFGIWASGLYPLGADEQPKKPDLIELLVTEVNSGSQSIIFTVSVAIFYILRAAQ